MKYLHLFIFTVLMASFQSCTNDACTNTMTYTEYTPIYVLPDTIDKEIKIEAPRPLKNPGKIYFYQDYIFINEPYEGFHIINNKVPSAPVNERFVRLVGNVDLAVKDDYLYADAYIDLVIIDLHNMDNLVQLTRKPGIFKGTYHVQNSGAILSHYKEGEKSMTIDCSHQHYGGGFYFMEDNLFVSADGFGPTRKNGSGVIPGGSVGKGGSLARFTIAKDHLYAIGSYDLYSFSISENGQVSEPKVTNLPWGIETIFPYKDYLFIGANNGVHLVSIEDPKNPVVTSKFDHARACDPVVVQDDIAFVTLRDGTECLGYLNQLDIIDVKDVKNPKLLHTYSMEHPHGLAIEGEYLYLCEGQHGLKVFNVKDLGSIHKHQVGTYKDFHISYGSFVISHRK
jgi:hypothetical protein